MANRRKHKLSVRLAAYVFADPACANVYDRFEGGEHRWHAVGLVGFKRLLAVHTYPDSDDEGRVPVIGLREATSHESRRYEEGDFG